MVAPKTLLAHWEKELSVCGLASLTHEFYGTSQSARCEHPSAVMPCLSHKPRSISFSMHPAGLYTIILPNMFDHCCNLPCEDLTRPCAVGTTLTLRQSSYSCWACSPMWYCCGDSNMANAGAHMHALVMQGGLSPGGAEEAGGPTDHLWHDPAQCCRPEPGPAC